MTRIKIKDIPKNEQLSKEDIKRLIGGTSKTVHYYGASDTVIKKDADVNIEDLKKKVYDGWECDNESYYFFKEGKLVLKIPVLFPFFYFLKDFHMLIKEASED